MSTVTLSVFAFNSGRRLANEVKICTIKKHKLADRRGTILNECLQGAAEPSVSQSVILSRSVEYLFGYQLGVKNL